MSMDKSSKRKTQTHSKDMTIYPDDVDGWEPTPEERDACPDSESYPIPLGGTAISADRVVAVMTINLTGTLIAFALIQETELSEGWTPVTAIDTKHGHIHQHNYGRSTLDRVGDPVKIKNLTECADVQDGYNSAYRAIVADWKVNRKRWHHA